MCDAESTPNPTPVYPSYHDVVVVLNGVRHRLFDSSYGLRLTCTRAGGWELWNAWSSEGYSSENPELLGGEYHDNDFSIEVSGTVICKTFKKAKVES